MKKIIICYFASVGALICFTAAVCSNNVPIMIATAGMFAGCVIWFTDIMRQISQRKERRKEPCKVREFYSIDIPLDDDIKKGNVRPGSRPSEMYLKMVGGDEVDSGTENQATAT